MPDYRAEQPAPGFVAPGHAAPDDAARGNAAPGDAERGSAAPTDAAPGGQPSTGLTFRTAATIDEVVEAWRLVYGSYRRKELIPPNRYRIHTTSPAADGHAGVITGNIGALTVTTMTAIPDGTRGLPLDRVYPAELARLRAEGRRMMEVGLFADRRRSMSRSSEALLQLMQFVWHWGRDTGITDFVIGVHPRHAKFYKRAFGFHIAGDERHYAAVNNRPVVLLRGQPELELSREQVPSGLVYFEQNPVDLTIFDRRYRFPIDEVSDSLIGRFLEAKCLGVVDSLAA